MKSLSTYCDNEHCQPLVFLLATSEICVLCTVMSIAAQKILTDWFIYFGRFVFMALYIKNLAINFYYLLSFAFFRDSFHEIDQPTTRSFIASTYVVGKNRPWNDPLCVTGCMGRKPYSLTRKQTHINWPRWRTNSDDNKADTFICFCSSLFSFSSSRSSSATVSSHFFTFSAHRKLASTN